MITCATPWPPPSRNVCRTASTLGVHAEVDRVGDCLEHGIDDRPRHLDRF
jgi:hypothetical protein